jgi:hypothetical protein
VRDEQRIIEVNELERRLDRDDERERFDRRRQRTIRRPRYSRFRTLARITANRDAFVTTEQATLANNGKRAA